MFEFDDRVADIARLVNGVESDPRKWERATHLTLLNAYGYSNFFSTDLYRLNRRCDPIANLVKKLGVLDGEPFGRRALSSAASGEAVTLRQLTKISYALTRLAAFRDKQARQALRIGGSGAGAKLFAMGENSVVMSMHWANPHMIRSLRKNHGLSKREFGELIFGKHDATHAIFDVLEDGSKIDDKRYDYRITKHTAELMYRGFELIFRYMPKAEVDREKDGVEILGVMPEFSHFFDPRHTSGPQNGKRTVALQIPQGNILEDPSPSALKDLQDRIKRRADQRKAA